MARPVGVDCRPLPAAALRARLPDPACGRQSTPTVRPG